MSKIKNLWQSKTFRLSSCFLLTALVLLIVFQAGRFVGFHQAGFSYRFGDNYYRAFEGSRHGGRPMDFFGDNLPGGHGAIGKIVGVNLPTFVVIGPDNVEKVVLIKDETLVKRFRETASSTDLRVDDFVVVLGSPNEAGQVEAKFVRIMPPPPGVKATSTPH